MFTIESQTSDISESEFLEIFIKKSFTDSLNDIDHTHITTEIESIAECMPSLTFIVIEIVDFEFIDFYTSSILVDHVWFDFCGIETNSCCESLKYTSWLIW